LPMGGVCGPWRFIWGFCNDKITKFYN
jgi:hypothetical protein